MTNLKQFKIVLIGDSSVGKSSLLRRFNDYAFEESYQATIGVEFKFKTFQLDGSSINLQIWDTAGQERFRAMSSSYYRNAHGIMLVFDLKIKNSLYNIEKIWLDQVIKYGEKEVQLVMVGNKADSEIFEVMQEQLVAFVLKHNIPCFRVSAKTGSGVSQAYEVLAKACLKQFGKQSDIKQKCTIVNNNVKDGVDFGLKAQQQQKHKNKCC